MHARHVVPFLLLFAWQVAPSGGSPDPPATLRIWLGSGERSFDLSYWGTGGGYCLEPVAECTCRSFAPSYPLRYDEKDKATVSGVQVDAWPLPTLRLSAARGVASGPNIVNSSFIAALAGWEGSLIGLGGGWAEASEHLAYTGLAAYLRVGPLDGAHFRADLRAPSSTPGVTGWARAGLGYNLGQRDGASVFLGVSAVEAGPDTTYPSWPGVPLTQARPALFLDASLPLGRTFGFFLRGHVAKMARGVAAGITLRLLR